MSAALTSVDSSPLPRIRLAGWIPAGMLDWPGRLAATAFISGCDYRCSFCHNPDLISRTRLPAENVHDLIAYLDKRSAWIDGVVITGGEPTTDSSLSQFLELIRSMGVSTKLDTNGDRPEVLQSLLEQGLVDHVAVDIKTVPHRYDRVTGSRGTWPRIARSVSAIQESGVSHEFRTTLHPASVTLGELETIAELISGGMLYALQQFRTGTTLDRKANDSEPYHPDAIRAAADRCSEYIPTITRGV